MALETIFQDVRYAFRGLQDRSHRLVRVADDPGRTLVAESDFESVYEMALLG